MYELYRYVPRDRVGFFLSVNRVSFLPLLALCSRCDPLIGCQNCDQSNLNYSSTSKVTETK